MHDPSDSFSPQPSEPNSPQAARSPTGEPPASRSQEASSNATARSSANTRHAIPSLTIQQLEYLVTVAAAPTWAVAAQQLGVSASALSQGMAELERRLGLKLFERVGRRRVLAASSAPILAYAVDVVAKTSDLGRWIQEQDSGHSGQLRVGMIDAAALHYFSQAMHDFRISWPQVDLRLTVAPSGQLLQQTRNAELDLAVIVRPKIQPSDVEFTQLAEDPLAIYSPHEPAPRSPQSWGPWVAFPQTSHTRAQIVEHLTALGASYDVVAESNQPEVLCEMVRLGLGWAVLPVVQAESGPAPLDRASPRPIFNRQIVATRRAQALPHPGAERLLARLQTMPGMDHDL